MKVQWPNLANNSKSSTISLCFTFLDLTVLLTYIHILSTPILLLHCLLKYLHYSFHILNYSPAIHVWTTLLLHSTWKACYLLKAKWYVTLLWSPFLIPLQSKVIPSILQSFWSCTDFTKAQTYVTSTVLGISNWKESQTQSLPLMCLCMCERDRKM